MAPDQFGIAVCDVNGQVWRAGAADTAFSIQSISKVLNLVIAMQRLDEADIWTRVGREAFGHAFNPWPSWKKRKAPRNPFINARRRAGLRIAGVAHHVDPLDDARTGARLAGNPTLNFDDPRGPLGDGLTRRATPLWPI